MGMPGCVTIASRKFQTSGCLDPRPVDFRKGIDGLALAVQEVIGLDPFSGAAFVFRAKRADRI